MRMERMSFTGKNDSFSQYSKKSLNFSVVSPVPPPPPISAPPKSPSPPPPPPPPPAPTPLQYPYSMQMFEQFEQTFLTCVEAINKGFLTVDVAIDYFMLTYSPFNAE